MSSRKQTGVPCRVPSWVPEAAWNYLDHTEAGLSIRALARAQDCHPSTVLRQVRRFEMRRDDPLIDAALTSLSKTAETCKQDIEKEDQAMNMGCVKIDQGKAIGLTQARIDQEAKRVLRRLCETGAVLAIARDMETAVVVRETGGESQIRTATVDRAIAEAMALKDWIGCPDPSLRIARYFITNAGRAALRRLTAADENRASGFSEARSTMDGDAWDIASSDDDQPPQGRYHATESPLVGLSRRKDRDGTPFLSRDMVAAGERLREDFELAQVGLPAITNWDGIMGADLPVDAKVSNGATAARARVKAALTDLGPGLGDVVLRCCCLLQGLEQTEKKMGWSARSGKIVLRIALQRLMRHFSETQGKYGPMIG